MPSSPEYRCPGEQYAISRSVHLARLAAWYPKCRQCPLGEGDAGRPLPASNPLFRTNGIRGRYLNEVDRRIAAELAGAFASLLWDRDPPLLQGLVRHGPSVAVGFDERPSSPDIVLGVVGSLRRMGCQVVEIGLATRACLWHACHHVHATAGVFVTGAGCDPSWTGLDFVGPGVVPLSKPGLLDDLERRWTAGFARTTRQPASHRTFPAWVPYEAGLWKHFHALRPLSIVVACGSATIRETLARLFHSLACRLTLLATPLRAADPLAASDPDMLRLRESVLQGSADLGVFVAEDGQQTVFVDERGDLVPPAAVIDLLEPHALAERPQSGVIRSIETLGGMAAAFHREGAGLGGDSQGHVWFDDLFPTVDAIVTIAQVLQAMSGSDASLSACIRDQG